MGKNSIQIYDRQIHFQLVFKALAILTISFFVVCSLFFVLLITETIDFLPLLFESVSAFATVGYSLGISSDLTDIGKLMIIFLMFFGRVGPLALALALTQKRRLQIIKFLMKVFYWVDLMIM